ncbi:MAG: biotin/lipoyl-containing protein [Chloroherpetonaceae bacterium]|nr:hypothetical protein [Chthonomonadaceae bacterium]MDW8207054.1 biotin/lipoyl-containing protein [Chloroherpetonaceae bacterium]
MDLEELERLAAMVQKANIRELTLRQGDARITLRKSVSAGEPSILLASEDPDAEAIEDLQETLLEDTEDAREEQIFFVTAPLVGVFRHVNPVVGLGATVKAGQVVGVIESMNLAHEVQASEGGVVTDVMIEDGVAVEYGQRLFALQVCPASEPGGVA